MDEIIEQYGETIVYTILGIMLIGLGLGLMKALGTI